jgi:hypothetical protein
MMQSNLIIKIVKVRSLLLILTTFHVSFLTMTIDDNTITSFYKKQTLPLLGIREERIFEFSPDYFF